MSVNENTVIVLGTLQDEFDGDQEAVLNLLVDSHLCANRPIINPAYYTYSKQYSSRIAMVHSLTIVQGGTNGL